TPRHSLRAARPRNHYQFRSPLLKDRHRLMAAPDRIIATILGCGSSGGVPRIGNDWGDCDPEEPRNRRRRCALLIEGWTQGIEEPTRILIDTGVDLREQLLDARVDRVDAVLYTHEHADHTHGI